MNLNTVRTILTGAAGLIPLIYGFFGCKEVVAAMPDCSASWIPAQYILFLSGGLAVLSFVLKMFGQGGTVTENLTKPSVVVTPEAKAGTVTPAQVSKSS